MLLANAPDGLEAAHLADRLRRGLSSTILHVAHDGARLRFLAGMVAFFAPEVEIVEIPAWDCLPYDRISPSAGIMAERLRALGRLAAGPGRGKRLILTTANAIVQKVPPPERVRAAHLRAKSGGRVDRDALVAYLERNGYHRTSAVVEAGDYAVRGGLVDVFPSGHEQPVRLDFFGSTLESIRSFDPLTQRSQGKVAALELMPVSEVLLDAEAVEAFKAGYLRRFGAVTGDPLLESVEAGRGVPGHGALAALVPSRPGAAHRLSRRRGRDRARPPRARGHQGPRGADRRALRGAAGAGRRRAPASARHPTGRCRPSCSISTRAGSSASSPAAPGSSSRISARRRARRPGSAGSRTWAGRPSRDFAPERANRSVNLFDAIVAYLDELVAAGERPLLAAYSEGTADRLRQVLADHGFDRLTRVERWAEVAEVAGAAIAVLPVERGFKAPGDPCHRRARPSGRPADRGGPAHAARPPTSSSRTSPPCRRAISSSMPSMASAASRAWRRCRSPARRTTA